MIMKTRNIPDGKSDLLNLTIHHHKEAEFLYYPVTSARCAEGETCVVGGQYVKVGEELGMRRGAFFEQPIHATASGEIVGIEKHYDQSGKMVDCVILKNDQKYEMHESVYDRTQEEINNLTRADLIEIAKDMGLVGLGGSAFPTYIKLSTDKVIDTIVVNGVECEPYLVADYELMLNHTHSIIKGLTYTMRAMGAKKGVIAVKKKYPELASVLEFAINEYPDFDIEVVRVGNHYPQGWELETIEAAIGVKIPQFTLTADYGVLVFNVSTLSSIHEAVEHRLPVLSRFFTLSGEGINNMSFNARIGTLVSDLVDLAGGYKDEHIPKVLILGGPMMGANTTRDNVVMTHTTTSMIVLNNEDFFEEPCIHCAACVYSCPVKIEPVQIMNALKAGDFESLEVFDVNKCIECGLCSFVCPSKIPLTDYMKKSKQFLREKRA